MMRIETRIRIYRAAEDWVHGYLAKHIAARHNISVRTFYRWKKTEAWKRAIGNRPRQRRMKPVVNLELREIEAIKAAASGYVEVGKPPLTEFADYWGVPVSRLEKWATTLFWHDAVLYAEHKVSVKKKAAEALVKVGKKFPIDLLRKAVSLSLYGLSARAIAGEVGRTERTIKNWKKTDAWIQAHEEILNDQLKMRIRDVSTTINEMARQIVASHRRL